MTSRCLDFALRDEDTASLEALDDNSESYFETLTDNLEGTVELLEEMAKREGMDVVDLFMVEAEEVSRSREELIENHDCCFAAKSYEEMVDEWFESASDLLGYSSPEPPWKESLGSADLNPAEEDRLSEALEVIRWYQHQICVKLMRAVRGGLREMAELMDEFPKDSDGSAKVALIGIDRSITAWEVIRSHFPLLAGGIIRILARLEELRKSVERAFPGAREFIRPGFDRVELNS